MSRKSPSRNPAIAVLLCIGAVAACGEPQCPRGFFKKGDTCYRIRDGGAQSTDAVEGEDASIAEDDEAGSLDDVFIDAGPEAGSRDAPDAPGVDAGMPAVDAAPAIDAAPAVDAALPVDGGGESDSATLDAGKVTCASQPCQNGGTCTDDSSGVRCSCSEPFIGDRCEAKTCPTVFLRTPEDLAKARLCGEIQGDLLVASAGIASITASDLPHLTKITGTLNVSNMLNNGVEAPRLRSLTLAALREVDASLNIVFPGSGSVEDVRFPSLTRVGTGGEQHGISFGLTETRLLDLSALTTVNGHFHITGLYYLCSLYLGKLATVTGGLSLHALYNLPSSAVARLIDLATEMISVREIGCCAAGDRLACDEFSSVNLNRCGC